MKTEAISDTGLVRKGNEDSYLLNNRLGLFAVADGMGGHEAGEVASHIAVTTLEKSIEELRREENALDLAIQAANVEIYNQAQENQAYNGMGTTITALYCGDEKVYIGHVGDSRAYLLRKSQITLLTRDHSLVNELLLGGHISEEEALNHPQRHVVTRALGIEPTVEVDILSPAIEKEDKILLCTDGLSNLLKPEEMLQVIQLYKDPADALQALKQMALERGGFDNITALLVEF